MRMLRLFAVVALAMFVPLAAAADPLIPAKRLQLWDNTDLPKGDLSSNTDRIRLDHEVRLLKLRGVCLRPEATRQGRPRTAWQRVRPEGGRKLVELPPAKPGTAVPSKLAGLYVGHKFPSAVVIGVEGQQDSVDAHRSARWSAQRFPISGGVAAGSVSRFYTMSLRRHRPLHRLGWAASRGCCAPAAGAPALSAPAVRHPERPLWT